jgi:hypothetical protein
LKGLPDGARVLAGGHLDATHDGPVVIEREQCHLASGPGDAELNTPRAALPLGLLFDCPSICGESQIVLCTRYAAGIDRRVF